jgi:6-pyruvoyltetrahydropterin/6-carboxytetrahydropterin synthase
MSTTTVKVRHEFCAGHRILGLTGPGEKCRNIHGHNFTCWWMFEQSPVWPPTVEFGFVKAKLKEMIDRLLDHAFIVHESDDFLDYLSTNSLKRYPLRDRPTTEAIAAEIARLTEEQFPDLDLVYVQLTEGSNNEAMWMADDTRPKSKYATGGLIVNAQEVGRATANV